MGRRAEKASLLVEALYKKPVMTAVDIAQTLDITPIATTPYIEAFIKNGILKEVTGRERNRVFEFKEYLGLFEKEII